jgi:hypothetical protein
VATATVLWAGKHLTGDEEAATRRLVHMLRRAGSTDLADRFERFLPEHAHRWTPDELELGAHAGPWLRLEAAVGDEPADCP